MAADEFCTTCFDTGVIVMREDRHPQTGAVYCTVTTPCPDCERGAAARRARFDPQPAGAPARRATGA